jgi:hypothetical protein
MAIWLAVELMNVMNLYGTLEPLLRAVAVTQTKLDGWFGRRSEMVRSGFIDPVRRPTRADAKR